MYKVEVKNYKKKLSKFDNTQLICSYLFLQKTFNYFYKENLRKLDKREKKAIIYDLKLFETIKNKRYNLRCSSPEKWFKESKTYTSILKEIRKRDISGLKLDN